MTLDNLKLGTKALFPLTIMALVVIGVIGFGAMSLHKVSSAAEAVIERRDVGLADLARASRRILEAPYSVFGILLYDANAPEGKVAADGFPKAVDRAVALLDQAAEQLPERAGEIATFKRRFIAVVEKAKKPIEIGKSLPALSEGRKLKPEELDQFAQGARLIGEVDTQIRAIDDDLLAFYTGLIAENAQAAADLRNLSSRTTTMMIAAGSLATLLAAAFSLWLTRAAISGPLSRLAARMGLLAHGDLSVEIDGEQRRDEIGDMARAVLVFKKAAMEKADLEHEASERRVEAERERARHEQAQGEAISTERAIVAASLGTALSRLAQKDLTYRMPADIPEAYRKLQADFNEAIAQLESAMKSVTGSADSIKSGTREIAAASDDLSRRTEQQAASLEETAAAIGEITTTVRKSAEGANHAREVVTAADVDAKKSAVVVGQAVEAMGAISESSGQIGQIIGVIDEIAFQTNLLALNAGVEAARAGDAGRGFAVVASEVRALAQRSAEAAKEIKELISKSTTQVEAGVKLVGETGKSLERIIAQVMELNNVIADIAAGAKEQATALQQVNRAISQMDQSTQQNATMVEESTAASHSLSQETQQLARLMDQFRLGGGGEKSAGLRQAPQKAAPQAVPKAADRPAPRAATPRLKVASGAGTREPAANWDEF